MRLVAEHGLRVFALEQLRELLEGEGIPASGLPQQLHRMVGRNSLTRLRRGLYALPEVFLAAPLHEFEIATALVEPAALSHWTALSLHGLTEQVPREVFVLTTTQADLPRYRDNSRSEFRLGGVRYRFTRVPPAQFFGVTRLWIGPVKLPVTDPERSLVDGFQKPALVGGMEEILGILEEQLHRLDLSRLVDYAGRIGAPTARRLGWALQNLGVEPALLGELEKVPMQGYRPLDPSKPRRGSCDSRWGIQENLRA